MNYYPFHIGDYLSATRHLSWEEDAAYRRLLDTYYTTEKALPKELRAVCRLVLATTDGQREAVETVLREFFELTDEGWINRRADGEIVAMREKQQKQRDKANKRWQKPESADGNAPAMPRHESGDAMASKSDANAMPPTPTPTPTPYSVANATDGVAVVVDPAQMTKDELWAAGKSLLIADGLPAKQCGSFVGKLVKDYGAEAALEAVRAAVVTRPAGVRDYLLATCKHASGQRQRPNSQEALEAANRAVAERFIKELDHASH